MKLTKKTKVKIISTILTIMLLVLTMTPMVLAGPLDGYSANPTKALGNTDVKSKTTQVLGIIQAAGLIVAIIILMVLGIKYLMATASEKADLKGKAINYIIGAAILFLAPTIVKVLYDWFTTTATS